MIINEILEIENHDLKSINLIAQGNFYRAYNGSAMLFEELFFKYKIQVKLVKKVSCFIYYLGFPKQNLKLIEKKCKEKGYEIIIDEHIVTISNFDNNLDYLGWVEQQNQKNFYKINPNVNDRKRVEILKKLNDFPLDLKTPFEAFEFLHVMQRNLKHLEL